MRKLILILVLFTNAFTTAQILGQSADIADGKELLQSYLSNFDRDDSRRYYIQEVVYAEGLTKEQLYIALKIKITQHFQAAGYKQVAEDIDAGVFVVRGWTDAFVSDGGVSSKLSYSIKLEIRDSKYRFRIFRVDFNIQDANSSEVSTGTLTDLINKSYSEDCQLEINADYSDVTDALQSIVGAKESLSNFHIEALSTEYHE